MKRNWIVWIPLMLLAFVAGISIYRLTSEQSEYVPTQMAGQMLPEFALDPAVEGVEGLSSKNFGGGKPRLLNVFASWCIPCKAEAPNLEKLRMLGAEIHAIAVKDKPEDVAAFLEEFGNPFSRIGADPEMLVQVQLGSKGVPETYVVDGTGRITYHHIGDIRAEHVAMLLDKLGAAQ